MPATADSSFQHQAFLYASPDEFVASMVPFVREGLERGDRVFAAAKRQNIDALREELDGDAGLVDLHDATEWCTRPYDRLQAFKRLVNELPDGGVLRAMGEPVWDGSDAVVRQWARYESLINMALAGAPMRFICLYDSAALPDRILDYAVHTHPERVENGSCAPCPGFVPPEQFLPGPPARRPPAVPNLPLEGGDFRRILRERSQDAGLAPKRIADFVLAANEVVTNALHHGRAPVRAHVWAHGDELVCQIADSGPGISDPLAGWAPPPPDANGGWGLSIARQVCDVVEIVPGEHGTVVSLYMPLGTPSAVDTA